MDQRLPVCGGLEPKQRRSGNRFQATCETRNAGEQRFALDRCKTPEAAAVLAAEFARNAERAKKALSAKKIRGGSLDL